MNNFLSQNQDALTKKKRRWKPIGRQVDEKSYQELALLFSDIEIFRDELIEYLHLIQDNFGCLYDKHLTALAEFMKIPLAEVYEVATFYAHFNVVKDSNIKAPEVTVRVCESLTCEMFGSQEILKSLSSINNDSFNIVPGPCMGRCQHAPTVSVGKNYVDNANVDKILKIVEKKEYQPVITNYINIGKIPFQFFYLDYPVEPCFLIMGMGHTFYHLNPYKEPEEYICIHQDQ